MSDHEAPRRAATSPRPRAAAPAAEGRAPAGPGGPRPARDRETIRRRLASGFYHSAAAARALAGRLLDAGALE